MISARGALLARFARYWPASQATDVLRTLLQSRDSGITISTGLTCDRRLQEGQRLSSHAVVAVPVIGVFNVEADQRDVRVIQAVWKPGALISGVERLESRAILDDSCPAPHVGIGAALIVLKDERGLRSVSDLINLGAATVRDEPQSAIEVLSFPGHTKRPGVCASPSDGHHARDGEVFEQFAQLLECRITRELFLLIYGHDDREVMQFRGRSPSGDRGL